MMRIDDLLGKNIVSVEEGFVIGSLKGVELDMADGQIHYLHFRGAGSRPDGVVPWTAVRSVGDNITVETIGAARDQVPAADRDRLTPHVGDRSVVTESGSSLGKISSYDVDETTGRVVQFHIKSGLLGRITGNEITFGHEAVRTFGRDAVIVSDEVGRAPKDEEEQQRAA